MRHYNSKITSNSNFLVLISVDITSLICGFGIFFLSKEEGKKEEYLLIVKPFVFICCLPYTYALIVYMYLYKSTLYSTAVVQCIYTNFEPVGFFFWYFIHNLTSKEKLMWYMMFYLFRCSVTFYMKFIFFRGNR